jgi:hypothetical protein
MTIGSGAEKCPTNVVRAPKKRNVRNITARLVSRSRTFSAMLMASPHWTAPKTSFAATICENNEITCGNSYSTLWHVTARADSNRGSEGQPLWSTERSTITAEGEALSMTWEALLRL